MEKLKKLDIKKILNADISTLKKQNKVKSKKKPRKPLINKKFVSLDIGTQNTKIVVGKRSKAKIIVEKAFMFQPSVDAINDDSIQNLTTFPKEIEVHLRNNKIRVKDANCTGNSTTIINREIIIPSANEDELDTLVKFELQHFLPVNMDDYIVQFDVLEKIKVDELDKLRVLAVVYPKKLVKDYLVLLRTAKLKPNALDVNYNSIKKLIVHRDIINKEEYDPQETISVIDMGAETIEVNIYTGDRQEFTRIIKSGGKQIDNHIAKLLGVSDAQAEVKKIQDCDLLDYKKNEIAKIIRFDVQEWMEELGRIFQFYKNKKVDNNINKILIHGGSSRLKGLDVYMEDYFNIPVNHIGELNNVVFNKNISSEDIDHYLNAIGALIRF